MGMAFLKLSCLKNGRMTHHIHVMFMTGLISIYHGQMVAIHGDSLLMSYTEMVH